MSIRSISPVSESSFHVQSHQFRAASAALCLGTALAVTASVAHAQQQQIQLAPEAMAIVQKHTVQASPLVVAFTPTAKTVSVDFNNPGDAPVTAALSIEFGVPMTNAQGLIVDSVMTSNPSSLVAWVQGLPASITIPAHGKQTVSLTLNVPANTKDGEYAGRIIAMVNNLPLQVPASVNGAPMQTVSMNFNLRTVLPVLYRQGTATSALEITKPTATVTGNTVQACMTLHHSGTAHFEGLAHVSLRNTADGSDKPITVAPLTVYDDMHPCLSLNSLPPGKYSLNFSVDGDRQDIPASVRLPVTTVTTSIPFEIAGTAAPAPAK